MNWIAKELKDPFKRLWELHQTESRKTAAWDMGIQFQACSDEYRYTKMLFLDEESVPPI